jgi:TfoX/Sxy family transcriptional regulator of competence genes
MTGLEEKGTKQLLIKTGNKTVKKCFNDYGVYNDEKICANCPDAILCRESQDRLFEESEEFNRRLQIKIRR